MKRALVITMLLVMLLVMTACKATPEAPAAAPEAAPAAVAEVAEAAAPEEAAAEATDYDYVAGKGELIIGYTVYEPMNFTDSDGNFTGFDTELSIAVCAKLGLEPNFVEINWDTKEVELNAKSIDCIWNGLTITDARKETMAITNAYVQNAQVVVMKADAEYEDTSTLVGKTVCAEAGSAGEEAIMNDENLINAHFIAKEVQTACLMEVSAGTTDAAVLDLVLAQSMIGAGTDYENLVIVDKLDFEEYGIAFRKGSDLCDKVNAILDELLADGTLAALAAKYDLVLA